MAVGVSASHSAASQPASSGRRGHGAAPGELVLIGESSESIAQLERLYLTREGFRVHVEATGAETLRAARSLRPDALVLDVALAELDGIEVYRVLRAEGDRIPVVLVGDDARTGEAGGLDPVPDDYIGKPFSPRELVEKVRDKVRGGHAQEPSREPSQDICQLGRVTIDVTAREVTMGGETVTLTNTEFELLAFLASHPGRVHTRQRLLAAVRGGGSGASARTVDVHVAQLRAKLGSHCPIRTVRGVGYLAAA